MWKIKVKAFAQAQSNFSRQENLSTDRLDKQGPNFYMFGGKKKEIASKLRPNFG